MGRKGRNATITMVGINVNCDHHENAVAVGVTIMIADTTAMTRQTLLQTCRQKLLLLLQLWILEQ